VVGDLAGNLAKVSAAIERSAAATDVLVLPELATSGYSFADAREARACALSATDPVFDRWHDLAGPAVLVAGFAELGDDGQLYNSAVLIDRDGSRTVYRKTHLWDSERLFFSAGGAAPPVVDTAVGHVAMLICYDLEFPELTRGVALAGAELLAVPTNWPLVPRPAGEHPPEVVIAMAAARVNRMVIACCDRRGTERGQEWTQGSTVIGADGWPVAVADVDGLLHAEVDLAATRSKHVSSRNDLFADRRTDVYAAQRRYSPIEVEDGRPTL
jgi:predicted amidohydrolase